MNFFRIFALSIFGLYLAIGAVFAFSGFLSNLTYAAFHMPSIFEMGFSNFMFVVFFQMLRVILSLLRFVTWPLVVYSWLSGHASFMEMFFAPWASPAPMADTPVY